MTQEQKDLLLKDLCARLPYGVKVQTTYINPQTKERKDIGTDVLSTVEISLLIDGYYELKPYLFPLSSMTKEQKKEYVYYEWDNWYDEYRVYREIEDRVDAQIAFFNNAYGLLEDQYRSAGITPGQVRLIVERC